MIVMFAKEKASKRFNNEKFEPMVEVTPRLAAKIPVHKRKAKENLWDMKNFPGGFLKFVSSNSPDEMKSTPAPVLCVEEPDDCNVNVHDQGDAITLLRQRSKSFVNRKFVLGGTPTVEGFSAIETAYLGSDQRN
jgi:phage terminase large subunit GpA-like protein